MRPADAQPQRSALIPTAERAPFVPGAGARRVKQGERAAQLEQLLALKADQITTDDSVGLERLLT